MPKTNSKNEIQCNINLTEVWNFGEVLISVTN